MPDAYLMDKTRRTRRNNNKNAHRMQQPKNKKKLHERSPSNNKKNPGVVELSVLVAELFSGSFRSLFQKRSVRNQ